MSHTVKARKPSLLEKRTTSLIITLGFVAGLLSPAQAIPPSDDLPPGIAGRTFVPNAGFIRTNKVNYLLRQAETTSRNFVRPRHSVLQGSRSAPVILLDFANASGDFQANVYSEMLFGRQAANSNGFQIQQTLTQYYLDISYNNLSVTGDVYGWYTLPQDDTYYENGDHGVGTPFGELLEFGLKKADAETDFGEFDNDGPDGEANSGDDDGKVDTVFFVHSEKGAECDPDVLENIWSHSWHYSESSYGHSAPFKTGDARKDRHGNPMLNPDGSEMRIVVEDYVIQPGLSCSSEPSTPALIEIGVFCHEYGHALGLPDLYDRTPQGGADSEGIGNWGLMAGGSYGGDGESSAIPDHMSAWSKLYLGWAIPVTITESGKYAVEPVERRGMVYRINVPDTQNKEFFLIEYRSKEWRDDLRNVQFNWDQRLPNSGVAIWHIDERVGDAASDWPFAPHDMGQNDAPSIPPTHTAPIDPSSRKHSLVSLEQADHKLHLEYRHGRGDEYDLWVTETDFGNGPIADSRGYNNKNTSIQILVKLNEREKYIDVQMPIGIPTPPAPPAPAVERFSISAVSAPTESALIPNLPRSSNQTFNRTAFEKLKTIDQKIAYQGVEGLSNSEEQILAQANQWELEQAIASTHRMEVAQIATKSRTRQFNSNFTPDNLHESLIKELIQDRTNVGKEVTVTLDPDGENLQRMTDLQLPISEPTVIEDAQQRIINQNSPLKKLLGSDLELTLITLDQETADRSPIMFQQNVDYDGKALPIWGAEVSMYYDKDATTLAAVKSNAISPADLNITGTDNFTSPDGAKGQIHNLLNLSPDNDNELTDCSLGILPINGDPTNARLAFRACLGAGENQDDIHIYLDAETGEILEIR